MTDDLGQLEHEDEPVASGVYLQTCHTRGSETRIRKVSRLFVVAYIALIPSSTMITFMTSAFWHGIAGGYYLAFAFAGFVQTAMRLMRAHVRPLFLGSPTQKRVYDATGILVSVIVLNYAASPFMLLSIRDSLRTWAALGWYGQVLVFSALAFFWAGGARALGTAKTVRKDAKAEAKAEVKPAAMKEL
jgi:lysophospholipid acyltransferase